MTSSCFANAPTAGLICYLSGYAQTKMSYRNETHIPKLWIMNPFVVKLSPDVMSEYGPLPTSVSTVEFAGNACDSHYHDATSGLMRLISPTIRLFVQRLSQANNKGTIKAIFYWPFVRRIQDNWWILHTKRTVIRIWKCWIYSLRFLSLSVPWQNAKINTSYSMTIT